MDRGTDELAQAVAWALALEADARETAPLQVDGWRDLTAWLEADPRRRTLLAAAQHAAASRRTPAKRRGARRHARRRRAGWIVVPVGIAAALALALNVSPPSRMLRLTAPDGVRTAVLEDGSRVTLNRGGALQVRMQDGARVVRLAARSQAAFDVVHDPRRRFLIEVGGATITDMGTRFDVDDGISGLRVAVAQGEVAVTTGHGASVRLHAGEALRRDASDELKPTPTPSTAVSAWTRGVLVYEDAPLSQVAFDLSRYLGEPVRVDRDAADIAFTGTLAVDTGPKMLSTLLTYLPIRAARSSQGVRLGGARPGR